jgi:ATP-dependent Clp protease ATP-binding subunit ClpC
MSDHPQADSASLEITTQLVVEELWGGDVVVYPVADLSLVSCGAPAASMTEQRMFLAEYLSRVPPQTVARFVLPDGTRLRSVDVIIPREDLPHRLEVKTPLAIPCLVIPAGKDAWVVALPLRYTLYVTADEDLEEAVRSEVRRMVAAQEPSALEYLSFFPTREQRLESVTLDIERTERAPAGRAASLRKAVADRQKRKRAVEVLESVAQPLHLGKRPRVLRPLEGRDAELKLLSSLLGGNDRLSVAILGPELVGKTALFQAWLEREMAEGRERLVYATSGAQLIAGMSGLGQWQERVRRVLESAHDLDAIVFFENLGDLFTERVEGWVDIAGAMKPYLEEGLVRLVGELRPDMLEAAESQHMGFFSCLSRIRLEPLSPAETVEALRGRVAYAARVEPYRPRLLPEAIEPLVDLAERYLPYRAFPGKAIRLYDELRGIHEKERTDKGEPIGVGKEHLFEFFSLSTGVPTFLLREDRTLDVQDVIGFLQKRVIGQAEAVRRVAEAVCVVKAGLQPQGKPLATFLFVGPTGVGKTELARALASFLFGAHDRMIRFDMSEYMDADAASRLIRGTDRAEGLLTRKVREQPFCVLLLDEIEKASRSVFDLLLQVCGEGRLTDARGKIAHFQNAIIILTSNLGAAHQRPGAGFLSASDNDEAYYARQVSQTFRPEFVNRIDRIIAFHALTEGQAEGVSAVALDRVKERRGLLDNGVDVRVSPGALAALARGGYSERYGARALRRHLEDNMVAPLARLLAGLGAEGRDSIVSVSLEGEPAEPPAGVQKGELSHGGIRIVATRKREGKGAVEVRGMDEIAGLRREAMRMMRLPRVEQVKEQIDYLVAQLNYGDRSRTDKRASTEIGELQADLHRLSDCYQKAMVALRDIETAEELAMMGLFDGEKVSPFLDEARALSGKLRSAATLVLLSQEPRRDVCTLMLQELDDGRAFDLYLPGLLADLERRGWSLQVHIDGDKGPRDPSWPSIRRWGPPRSPEQARALVLDNERSFRGVLVAVRGPFAGALMALEAGVHRFLGAGQDADRISLLCRLVSMSATFDDDEWGLEEVLPRVPLELEEAKRQRPVHTLDFTQSKLLVEGKELTPPARPAELWARLEELALERLLPYEAEDDERDREELFVGTLDRKRSAK